MMFSKRAHIVQASFYFGWIHFRVHFDSNAFPCLNQLRVRGLFFGHRCNLNNDFLNKAICIINFAKHFQNFIDDTMI